MNGSAQARTIVDVIGSWASDGGVIRLAWICIKDEFVKIVPAIAIGIVLGAGQVSCRVARDPVVETAIWVDTDEFLKNLRASEARNGGGVTAVERL